MSPPDCANHPTTARPNADITGIGISLAWLVTAGLALSLVIASYFIAYRPDFNPFTLENTGLQSERGSYLKSNPIDCLFLKWRLRKATVRVSAEAELQSNRIREALTLCMLTMSDYQLITGLAVLISAYSQLNPGISTLQWDRVIDLAWFSSITHLCCLTFLRDYFIQNKRAKIWRISGMIILVILLVVALVPSSRYSLRGVYRGVYTNEELYDLSSDYAYCFFKPFQEGSRPTYFLKDEEAILNKKQNVMISAAILIIGIANRIWRLYRTSTRFYILARGWISRHVKRFLRWTLSATQSKSFMLVALLYRPIIACYLVCHLILDVVHSKAFEVYWLTIGFFWGLFNLIGVSEPDDQVWTFGQVIALLMLISPIIALAETYCMTVYEAKPKPPEQVPTVESATTFSEPPDCLSNNQTSLLRGDPDFNFYTADSGAFIVTVCVIMLFILTVSALCLFLKGGGRLREFNTISMLWGDGWQVCLLLLNFTLCILCSLSIDEHTLTTRGGRIAVNVASFCCFGGMTATTSMIWLTGPIVPIWTCPLMGIGMYTILIALEIALKRRGKQPYQSLTPLVTSDMHSEISMATITTVPLPAPRPTATNDNATTGNGASFHLSPIDTGSPLFLPQRQDTEADLGITPMRM